jgi:hypothetical protein
LQNLYGFQPASARSGTPIFLDTPFIDRPRALIVLSPARGFPDGAIARTKSNANRKVLQ